MGEAEGRSERRDTKGGRKEGEEKCEKFTFPSFPFSLAHGPGVAWCVGVGGEGDGYEPRQVFPTSWSPRSTTLTSTFDIVVLFVVLCCCLSVGFCFFSV